MHASGQSPDLRSQVNTHRHLPVKLPTCSAAAAEPGSSVMASASVSPLAASWLPSWWCQLCAAACKGLRAAALCCALEQGLRCADGSLFSVGQLWVQCASIMAAEISSEDDAGS